ncbi:thioredoxin domain-containing protein 9 [Holotrichia oblita]|uniref:Thioredoxin domain-containing protein 9 n=1 Tax=Holotrichia oblita TaxID=644536 RepID=A0ACB9SMR9_HOLOL|nr:thioredoxin domain-containing protein 9 [Holotrichia oblita]
MDIQDKVLHVTKAIEKQVDSTIEQLDNLDVHDIENIRKQRMKELKQRDLKKQEWIRNGHGKYEELPEEKEFFEVIKKSENVIIHFYTNTNERCRIVDMHFKKLAPKHVETLFTSLNAEKCPFLAEKLKIKVIPSIICIHNGIMVDKLVGFTTLGNRDDFTTETLEWRLAQNEVIEYEGDLTLPPDEQDRYNKHNSRKIRDGLYNGVDDDLDIDPLPGNEGDFKTSQSYELTPEEEAELGLND